MPQSTTVRFRLEDIDRPEPSRSSTGLKPPPPMRSMTSHQPIDESPEPEFTTPPLLRPVASHDVTRREPDAPAPVSFSLEDIDPEPTFRTTNERDTSGNPAVRGLRDFWEQINPVTLVESVVSSVAHPIETTKGVGRAQGQLLYDAQEAFKAGDTMQGLRKTLHYLIPLIGPALDVQSEKGEEGDIAGMVGGSLGLGTAVAAPSVLKGTTVGLPPIVRNANRAEAAAAEFGLREGIPVDVATASGNRWVRGAQRLSDETMLGSFAAERAQSGQATALTRTGQRLADQASPAPITAEQAGSGVRNALETRINDLKATADVAYGRLRQLEQQTSGQTRAPHSGDSFQSMKWPVDVRPTRDALRPIYDQLMREKELVGALQGGKAKLLPVLDALMTGPDFAPLSVADKALSELKALARTDGMPAMRTQGQGIAARAVTELGSAVDTAAARGGPDVIKALNEGRAATRSKYAVADMLETLTRGTGDEPVRLVNRLTARDDTAIRQLRELQRVAPQELPRLGRAFLDDLLTTATEAGGFQRAQKLLAEWQGLGAETKTLLFQKPDYIRDLDHFFLLAKKLAENPNPSGTALTALKGGEIALLWKTGGASAPVSIGAGILSRLLHSPMAVRALTQGMSTTLGAPFSRTAATANLVRAAREAGVPLDMAPVPAEDHTRPAESPPRAQRSGTR